MDRTERLWAMLCAVLALAIVRELEGFADRTSPPDRGDAPTATVRVTPGAPPPRTDAPPPAVTRIVPEVPRGLFARNALRTVLAPREAQSGATLEVGTSVTWIR